MLVFNFWISISLTWKTFSSRGRTAFPAVTSATLVHYPSPWDNKVGMRYQISHRTTYKYVSSVSGGSHVACLKPRSYQQNQLVQNTLRISPPPVTLRASQ